MGDKPQVMASLVTNINNNFLHGKQCKGRSRPEPESDLSCHQFAGKKAQRSPSLLGERIKQLLGVEEEPDSPPRSRKGLYQSVSSSNLTHHPASSSLPPQVPRSFYLGELGELPSQLRGSRSLHTSPTPPASPSSRRCPPAPAPPRPRTPPASASVWAALLTTWRTFPSPQNWRTPTTTTRPGTGMNLIISIVSGEAAQPARLRAVLMRNICLVVPSHCGDIGQTRTCQTPATTFSATTGTASTLTV